MYIGFKDAASYLSTELNRQVALTELINWVSVNKRTISYRAVETPVVEVDLNATSRLLDSMRDGKVSVVDDTSCGEKLVKLEDRPDEIVRITYVHGLRDDFGNQIHPDYHYVVGKTFRVDGVYPFLNVSDPLIKRCLNRLAGLSEPRWKWSGGVLVAFKGKTVLVQEAIGKSENNRLAGWGSVDGIFAPIKLLDESVLVLSRLELKEFVRTAADTMKVESAGTDPISVFSDRSDLARSAVNKRHDQPGGNRERKAKGLSIFDSRIWKSKKEAINVIANETDRDPETVKKWLAKKSIKKLNLDK